jgi:hypothetical protein
MQFREQGKKIQCIRSAYDPASKRSHQKVVAAFERWADKVPSVEVADLTDAERQELAAWFEARQSVKAERMNQYRVMSAASTLAQLGESIKATGEAMTDAEAALTWRALTDVAKALRKAGHPKPKRERLAPVVSGQADLLAEAVEPAPAALPPASTGV